MNHEIKFALIRTVPFLVIICVILIRIRLKKLNPADLSLAQPNSIKRFALWVIGFLMLALLIEYILYSVNLLEVKKWNHQLFPSAILISGIVLFAPIAEELIFRGLLLNLLLKKNLNIHLSIFIQACFFVLLHNFTYQGGLSANIGIAQSLMDAVLFGYARMNTQSLYTPMAMHMTGNTIAVLERFIM